MESSFETLTRLSKGKEFYRNRDNVIIPGVTEVLKLLTDPYLMEWSNDLGLQGSRLKDYRDPLGDVGRLAHMEIMAMLDGRDPSEHESDFPPHIQDLAANCFLSACAWSKTHRLGETLCSERAFVSERLRYGGTPDRVWYVDDELEVTDFKTGDIREKAFYQAAAYIPLLIENGLCKEIRRVRIVHVGRGDDENFKEEVRIGPMAEWEIFKNLLEIYWKMKERKR